MSLPVLLEVASRLDSIVVGELDATRIRVVYRTWESVTQLFRFKNS